MINIDHVDQATVYLSKPGLEVEIVTTSTTGVNVSLHCYGADGRYKFQMTRRKEITLNGQYLRV